MPDAVAIGNHHLHLYLQDFRLIRVSVRYALCRHEPELSPILLFMTLLMTIVRTLLTAVYIKFPDANDNTNYTVSYHYSCFNSLINLRLWGDKKRKNAGLFWLCLVYFYLHGFCAFASSISRMPHNFLPFRRLLVFV